MRITLLSALLFVVQMSFAQSFMPAYNSTFSNDIEVTLNDGTIQKGKVVIYGMKRMTIKLENGEKIKENRRKSTNIHENPRKSTRIDESPQKSKKIHENPRKSTTIHEHP